MRRRRLLCAAGTLTIAGSAGCVEDLDAVLDDAAVDGDDAESSDDRDRERRDGDSDDDSNGTDSTDDDSTDTDSPEGSDPTEGPAGAVAAFVTAFAEGDVDAQEGLVHEEGARLNYNDEPVDLNVRALDRVDDAVALADDSVDSRAVAAATELDVDEHAFVYGELVGDPAAAGGSSRRAEADGEQDVEANWFLLVREDDEWSILGVFVTDARTGDDGTDDDEPADGDGRSEGDSGRLVALSTVGTVDDDGRIGTVRTVVAAAAGSEPVDLSDVTLQVVSEDGHRALVLAVSTEGSLGGDDLASDEFGVRPITDLDGVILSDSGDRAAIVFDGGGLSPGETATVTLVTAAGTSTEVGIRVPDQLPDAGEDVLL